MKEYLLVYDPPFGISYEKGVVEFKAENDRKALEEVIERCSDGIECFKEYYGIGEDTSDYTSYLLDYLSEKNGEGKDYYFVHLLYNVTDRKKIYY